MRTSVFGSSSLALTTFAQARYRALVPSAVSLATLHVPDPPTAAKMNPMTIIGTADGAGRRPATVLAGCTAIAAAVSTLAIVAFPFFSFAYPAPALHVMLETVNSVVAFLVMYLVYGRF